MLIGGFESSDVRQHGRGWIGRADEGIRMCGWKQTWTTVEGDGERDKT
jgi:hypothetical protein